MSNSTLYDLVGGFTSIPDSIIALMPKIGTEAFSLWTYLRFRTNRESNAAFPSYETIKKDTGLHFRKIAKALRILEAHDLVLRKKRFGNSTNYYLKAPTNSPSTSGNTDNVSPSTSGNTVLPHVSGQSLHRVQTTNTNNTNTNNTNTNGTFPKEEKPKIDPDFADIASAGDGMPTPQLAPVGSRLSEKDFVAAQILSVVRQSDVGADTWRGLSSSAQKQAQYAAQLLLNDMRAGKFKMPDIVGAVEHLRNGGGEKYRKFVCAPSTVAADIGNWIQDGRKKQERVSDAEAQRAEFMRQRRLKELGHE